MLLRATTFALALGLFASTAFADPPDEGPGAGDEEPAAAPPATTPDVPKTGDSSTTIVTPGPVIVRVTPSPAAPPPLATPRPAERPPAPASPPRREWRDDDLDAPYPKRAHFMARIGGGPSVYSFHGDRLLVGGAEVTLGADTKAGSFGGTLGLAFGKTEFGLGAWRFELGADVAWPIGPVRLGIGPRVGALGIGRVTYEGSFGFLTAGMVGIASVDLVQTDGFSLALGVRPSIGVASELVMFNEGHDNGGAIMGVSTLLELRFRAPKGPPRPKRPRPPR